MIQLAKGTVEHIPVNIADRLGNLTDLTGTNPTFDVKTTKDGTPKIVNRAATFLGMTAFCLVDTSILAKDRYQLFIKMAVPPEAPYLGPFDFEVI